MLYLKSKIVDNGKTIKEIAKEYNVSEQTLTNWIHDRNTSSILTFLKITLSLGFTIEDYKKLIK